MLTLMRWFWVFTEVVNMKVKRKFILGEDWMYIKVYAGLIMQDILLRREFQQLVQVFYEKKLIENFFFVRYNDKEGSHLRIRLKLVNNHACLVEVLQLLNHELKPLVDCRMIHRVVYDTYIREIERYDESNIEDAEVIFGYSSYLILEGLRKMYDEGMEDYRWIWGAKIMDSILDMFHLTIAEKAILHEKYFKMYDVEFGLKRFGKTELSAKYRKISGLIDGIFDNESRFFDRNLSSVQLFNLKEAVNNVMERSKTRPVNQIAIDSFLMSIMHMHYNRLFKSKQRLHELVMYFVLGRFYKSLAFRQEKVII